MVPPDPGARPLPSWADRRWPAWSGSWRTSAHSPSPLIPVRHAGAVSEARASPSRPDRCGPAGRGTTTGRQSPELRPLAFGDHLDGAMDDLNGRLFVDGVGRDADVGGP